MIYVISAVIGIIYGSIFSVLNNKILIKAVAKIEQTTGGQAATNAVLKAYLIRYVISVVVLLLMVLICYFTPLHFIVTIIATAVGLTMPGQIMLRIQSKSHKRYEGAADTVESER